MSDQNLEGASRCLNVMLCNLPQRLGTGQSKELLISKIDRLGSIPSGIGGYKLPRDFEAFKYKDIFAEGLDGSEKLKFCGFGEG